ncbi:MAG: EAL domain-containing protein [Parasulfuritortus sp.]|nr:EAL domain-containing protein [Parasulfuritortus sp.]
MLSRLNPSIQSFQPIHLLVVLVAYFLFGRLGLALPYVGSHISLIWAPAGIALAALLRWGPRMWPAIWLGAFAVNLSIGSSPLLAAGIACGNTLGPWAAARALTFIGFHTDLDRRRDLLAYLTVGAGAGMAINAINGALNLYLAGLLPANQVFTAGLVWWAGDASGALIAGIPLLTLRQRAVLQAFSGWRGLGNLMLLLAALTASALFFNGGMSWSSSIGLAFLPLLILIGLAARGGIWAASVSVLGLAVIAAWSIAHGNNPFHAGSLHEALVLLWSYMATMTIVTVLVTSLTTELLASEERWRSALEGSQSGVWDWDLASDRIVLTPQLAAMLGCTHQDCLGRKHARAWESNLHADDRQAVTSALHSLLAEKAETAEVEHRYRSRDGAWIWLQTRGRVMARHLDGQPLQIVGTCTDITVQKRAEEQMRLSATVFDQSSEVIMITDPAGRIVSVNKAFTAVTGYRREEALGNTPAMLKSNRQTPLFYRDLWRTLTTDGYWHGEVWNRRKNGEIYPNWLSISAVNDDKGKLVNYLSLSMDVSQHKAAEDRIRHLAYFDALTGLPNRLLLRDRASQVLAHSRQDKAETAFLFIDLDDFKTINDSLDHLIGDHLLQGLADRLQQALRMQDTVGRLGGDEFLMILPGEDGAAAAKVAERLLQVVSEPFQIDGHTLNVTASIGISLYPQDGADFDTLLKHADAALFQAKAQRRNLYHFYTPAMNEAAYERLTLENALRHALRHNEFELYYQPQARLDTGRIVGVEALIRWNHPEFGLVAPERFIPLAEENGLIAPLGDWMLREACRQAKNWQDAGLPPIEVAVNISTCQFGLTDMAQRIREALATTGLAPKWLEIEITESLLADNLDATQATLREIRELGVHIAVDDFGTGYSSLSYLKRFPLRKLKIDQSFVRDIMTDHDDRAISSAIINLGQSLGLVVVAEGVETGDQLEILRQLGCHKIQGYLLGAPIPAREITERLTVLATLDHGQPHHPAIAPLAAAA